MKQAALLPPKNALPFSFGPGCDYVPAMQCHLQMISIERITNPAA